jgi:hypothetical protein
MEWWLGGGALLGWFGGDVVILFSFSSILFLHRDPAWCMVDFGGVGWGYFVCSLPKQGFGG